ncbi:polyheme membrane-associated cytochrome C [Tranquillimonas alkanivorans]|uniref:Uncharacterized protein n=1 Tax=Tranquillimonas alkanivorans TaxID=441119 RepID=A0A1I5U3T9_9RHOB|nr:polyheme membrane-associated cytochrome C [Tranquillimonas alkanivorans]SFP89881.1 hypothetical protein SAMN04488047_11737 [Tranquillimonas alkanivorans]
MTRLYLPAVFAIVAAAPAAAQDAPTPEQIMEAWLNSPHADGSAEAFSHWDEEGEIPGDCAVCHSTPGFLSYIEGDRSTSAMIDHPVEIGTTVQCDVCHAPGVNGLEVAVFPSGETAGFGGSTVCAVCHQGRAWGGDVDAAVAGLDEDAVSPDLSFVNIHYSAAASTLMGSAVAAGYEYEGRDYAGPFAHVEPLNTCAECHSPHETTVALDTCTTCHQGIEDFRDIRATQVDVDGDGDVSEGIGHVIADLHDRLAAAIRTYAAEVSDAPVVYAEASYPYFFADTNADGAADADEAAFPNRYQSWTPRLLKAAYNYQYVAKDGGAFAHNPHYALQLMIDSIENLAEQADIDTTGLARP